MEVLAPSTERWYSQPTSVQLEKHEASWLAGLIDGEGSIGIHKSFRSSGTVKYRPVVVVSNTHLGLIQRIASLIPGSIKIHNLGRHIAMSHKVLYQFNVRAIYQLELLEAISPFLIIKYTQAQLLSRMCTLLRESPNRGAVTHHAVFERLWQECRELNKRGTGA
jgi:hypothetical protein